MFMQFFIFTFMGLSSHLKIKLSLSGRKNSSEYEGVIRFSMKREGREIILSGKAVHAGLGELPKRLA